MIPIIDKVKTGQKIKRMMQANHITPRDVMEYLNLSCVQTIYRWFEGTNIPSVDNLFAISRLLNVTMDDLVVAENAYEGVDNMIAVRLNRYLIGASEWRKKWA